MVILMGLINYLFEFKRTISITVHLKDKGHSSILALSGRV